jgi:outer membrane protein assembly factor BamA
MTSCSTTKNLEANESLLKSASIKITNEKSSKKKNSDAELASSLNQMLPQKPNKKFLNVWPIKLAIYNMVTRPKKKEKNENKKFKVWMRDKLGEPPVKFDSDLIATAEIRMINTLINNGYFYGTAQGSFVTEKQKTKVKYEVVTGPQYFINNIYRSAFDSTIIPILYKDSLSSLIKSGDSYSVENIKKERSRIADNFKNSGYFAYQSDYLVFEVDTSVGNYKLDIYMLVKEDTELVAFNTYTIGNVNFQIKDDYADDYKKKRNRPHYDTLRKIMFHIPNNELYPNSIIRSIFYEPDSLYSAAKYNQTINRLSDLGVFKFNRIRYEPLMISYNEGLVDVNITCELLRKQSWKSNLEMYTDDRKVLGTGLSFSYINKNLIRHAERFEFNVKTGLEIAFNNKYTAKAAFNSVNISSTAKIYFPKIFPSFNRKASEHEKYSPLAYKRNTILSVSYGFQRRLGYFNYLLNNINLSIGYDWKSNLRTRHEITPIYFTLQKPKENSFNQAFTDYLNASPLNKQLFSQQFILGQEYAYTYSSQDYALGKIKNFFYFRGGLSTYGNIIYGIQRAIKGKQPENTYFTLAGINYAQFSKLDAEYKHYFNFKNKSSFVGRFFLGVGIPYGNGRILPFVKQYAAGGPQSMRGWNFRTLGPGSLSIDSGSVDFRTGDMQFEANVEYRFNILPKTLRGALFCDIGNIWLYNADPAYPNANFSFKKLKQDLAVSAGWGIRLDFNLFIIRLDNGYKIHDPNRPLGDNNISEWSGGGWKAWRRRYSVLQFGIGYPF